MAPTLLGDNASYVLLLKTGTGQDIHVWLSLPKGSNVGFQLPSSIPLWWGVGALDKNCTLSAKQFAWSEETRRWGTLDTNVYHWRHSQWPSHYQAIGRRDPRDSAPLTPNHLLLLRSGPHLPPGNFVKQDIHKHRCRQVQYLAEGIISRHCKGARSGSTHNAICALEILCW